MANKTKQKRNLDEVSPLDLASVINPELAAAIQQAQNKQQDEVRPARSRQRQFTDNLVGSVRRQLNGEQIPTGWVTIPGAVTLAGAVANPVSAVLGMGTATGASKLVDAASKEVTGKDWTENVSKALDINPEVAVYTNPGLLAGGLPFTKGAKMIGNTVRGLYDAYRYGNASLQPNAFGQSAINTIRRLSGKNYKNINDINIEKLPFQQSLALSYSPTNAAKNFGNVVNLPSSNNVINIPDLNIDKRRILLKHINKIFASRYGYKSLPLAAANTRESTEEAIKSIMTQHNTFVRGVRDKHDVRDRTNALLKANGLEPTKENRLRWYATHYAPDTGAGRVGFYDDTYGTLGTIYTSNSFNVARGYADGRYNRTPGSQYIVRRPLDFSSPNLEDWVINNEFAFNGRGYTPAGKSYFEYELPYYLKHGKSLRSEYLKENPININLDDIRNFVGRVYFDKGSQLNAKRRRADLQRFIDRGDIDFTFPTMYSAKDHLAVVLANIENGVINGLHSRHFHAEAYNKQLKDFFAKHTGYYSPKYYGPGDYRYVFKEGDRKAHMIPDGGPFDFDKPDVNHPDYNPELSKELSDFIKTTRTKYITDAVKGYYYGRYKNINKAIETSKRTLNDEIKRRIRREYAKKANLIDISSYAESKGITPTTPRTILFGDRTGKNATINSKNNPWQHFVFTGPIDEQGLEVVRKIPWSEIENYSSTEGGHEGPWTEGLSRKVKRLGGCIPRRTLATGGSIHINPANRGKFNATKKRTGKTTEELTHSKNPLTRKRAIFAQNAAKWHH